VFCLVLEFRKEKQIFVKVEGGNVNFFPNGSQTLLSVGPKQTQACRPWGSGGLLVGSEDLGFTNGLFFPPVYSAEIFSIEDRLAASHYL